MNKPLVALASSIAIALLGGCTVSTYDGPPPAAAPAAAPAAVPVAAAPPADALPEEQPGDVETEGAPPPAQQEVIDIRTRPSPEHVWIGGHWAFRGRWVWVSGHWHRGQGGQTWAAGHWDRQPNGRWHWVGGHWQR